MSRVRLEQLTVGSKLLVRSKNDWRDASVRSKMDEKIVLNVKSPSGRTYLLRRTAITEIDLVGDIALLVTERNEDWRQNLYKQDARW